MFVFLLEGVYLSVKEKLNMKLKRIVSATQLRSALFQILDDIQDFRNPMYIILRNGEPKGVLLSAAAFEMLRRKAGEKPTPEWLEEEGLKVAEEYSEYLAKPKKYISQISTTSLWEVFCFR